MFTSFDESKFWMAVEEKDLPRLKINTVSAIRNDPTFSKSETETVLRVLDEKLPEIFEDEVDLGYEERLEPSAWDQDYFTKLTYWFQKNFAKSRLVHIKEVGRAVYKTAVPKQKATPAAAQPSQTVKKDKQATKNPTKAPEKTTRWPLIVGGIAAAAALVLIVTLLIQLLTK